ncbi:MAG: (2Fe-2S)-binding protein [Gracilibacteraceae bacterium]|jgi:NADH dehydrogenase/NADH:ubiquinone oxidoreductase subunit G|nr:(2Fe-2S)-binding protein [Gracilibacteraceae bacterium]
MNIVIDGKTCEARPGEFLWEIARRNGIDIPALCRHDALPGRGCCRLCIVEIETADGSRSVVVSCVYPVAETIVVYTKSEKIIRLRRVLLALLIERAPAAQGALPAYCREYGVTGCGGLFNTDKDEKCILCGQCTRACQELGTSAIQITRRGVDKIVAPPFDEPPQDCIGCAACARVCPTGSIECSNTQNQRTIWGKTFVLEKCAECGKPYATTEELKWLEPKVVDMEANLAYCPRCRGRRVAGSVTL